MLQFTTIAIPAVTVIVLALAIIKFFYYSRATKHKSIARWFYFREDSIIKSATDKGRRYKRLENTLSVFLFISLFFLLIFWYLSKSAGA